MEKEKVDYVFDYFGNLMTNQEKKAWRHYSSEYKLIHREKKDADQRIRKFYEKQGLISNDIEIIKLLENGIDKFKENVVVRILKQFPEKVRFNLCPNCNKLARTPLAKQCRHCGHDWH